MSESIFSLLILIAIGAFISALALAIYFVPTIVALSRKHQYTLWIFILNLITGASVVGWAIAFAWACIDSKITKLPQIGFSEKSSIAKEIEDLAQLKEKGIITQEDFEKRKNKLIES